MLKPDELRYGDNFRVIDDGGKMFRNLLFAMTGGYEQDARGYTVLRPEAPIRGVQAVITSPMAKGDPTKLRIFYSLGSCIPKCCDCGANVVDQPGWKYLHCTGCKATCPRGNA